MVHKKCILVFLKNPERGKVKSRLAGDLDRDLARSLYKNFVLDLLDTLKKGGHSFRICFYPPDAGEKLSDWLGKGYSYLPQNGKDLGERMKNAFLDAFSEGFFKALIIGSDIPDITNQIINEALESDDNDAVIGPSFDGGYYLIGFKHNTFLPGIFEGIEWGTNTVFEKTMEIFAKNRYKVHLLPKWHDVDRLEDLRALVDGNKNTDFANSTTMAFIRDNQKKLFGENKNH